MQIPAAFQCAIERRKTYLTNKHNLMHCNWTWWEMWIRMLLNRRTYVDVRVFGLRVKKNMLQTELQIEGLKLITFAKWVSWSEGGRTEIVSGKMIMCLTSKHIQIAQIAFGTKNVPSHWPQWNRLSRIYFLSVRLPTQTHTHTHKARSRALTRSSSRFVQTVTE